MATTKNGNSLLKVRNLNLHFQTTSGVVQAVDAVDFDLAYNGAGEPIQVRVIGERQRIPARYLEQIFQRSAAVGTANGRDGAKGAPVIATFRNLEVGAVGRRRMKPGPLYFP